MLSEERQRAILETLDRDGRVLVVDLAKHFQTSAVTIRKDLGVLHAKGRIQRTHGGALRVLGDPALQEKEKHRKDAKSAKKNWRKREKFPFFLAFLAPSRFSF